MGTKGDASGNVRDALRLVMDKLAGICFPRDEDSAGTSTPKVVMYHARYRNPGGEEQSFENEAMLFEQLGFSVRKHVTDNAQFNNTILDAFRAIFNVSTFCAAIREIRTHKPTLLYVNNTWPSLSPSVLLAARITGVPTLQAVRNYRLRTPSAKLHNDGRCVACERRRYFVSCVLHGCYNGSRIQSLIVYMSSFTTKMVIWKWNRHHLLATSDATRRLTASRFLPNSRIRVRANFSFSVHDPSFDVRTSAICVSRISPEKGVLPAVNAWPRADGAPILTVVGEGPEADELQRIAAQHPNVCYLGYVSPQRVIGLLRDSGVAIVPSQWAEPFGRVAIEAMSVGTPVIYTRHGALEDVVRTGGIGIDNLSSGAINTALALAFDPQLRHRSYGEYVRNYTSDRAAARMVQILKELL